MYGSGRFSVFQVGLFPLVFRSQGFQGCIWCSGTVSSSSWGIFFCIKVTFLAFAAADTQASDYHI